MMASLTKSVKCVHKKEPLEPVKQVVVQGKKLVEMVDIEIAQLQSLAMKSVMVEMTTVMARLMNKLFAIATINAAQGQRVVLMELGWVVMHLIIVIAQQKKGWMFNFVALAVSVAVLVRLRSGENGQNV